MNTELMILNKSIRQFNGLYCLNDLHKASGAEKRHELTNWLKLKQTTELIEELSKPEITGLEQNQQVIKTIRGGNQAGTYACRELVLAYATWISPRFFLLVLRTFDSVACGGALPVGKIKPLVDYPPCAPLLPPEETPLPRPPRNLDEARALFAQIDYNEKQADLLFNTVIKQRAQIADIKRKTKSWREYWLTVENDQ